jgi:intraflagellar transport protein 140
METALQFYTLAKDYLSLVRVYCYCDNLDKVGTAGQQTT